MTKNKSGQIVWSSFGEYRKPEGNILCTLAGKGWIYQCRGPQTFSGYVPHQHFDR